MIIGADFVKIIRLAFEFETLWIISTLSAVFGAEEFRRSDCQTLLIKYSWEMENLIKSFLICPESTQSEHPNSLTHTQNKQHPRAKRAVCMDVRRTNKSREGRVCPLFLETLCALQDRWI